MSAYEKVAPEDMLDYHHGGALHDPNAYNEYDQAPYGPHTVYHPGLNSHVQEADFQYVPGHQYRHTAAYEHEQQPVMDPREVRGAAVESSTLHQQAVKQEANAQNSRKRRQSQDESDYDVAPPQKKPYISQVQVQDPNGDYYDFSGHTSPYSQYVPTPTGSAIMQPAQSAMPSPRPSGHHYSTSTASQVSLAAPSPHTPAWSPSFTTVKSEHSPRPPMTPIPVPASTASPLKSSVPKLVRTSTIQTPPPSMGSMAAVHHQSFNPYAMYPLKATLKLRGDLNSMTKDWTSEERDCRRRLVEFKRSQSGSNINADFAPVAPQDRAPSSITISCILWAEKNEYYVTSVDTIYLLEALVGVRFTVEEKNRIRRNLEGFRPATVSKSRMDSEEFFKVIMGFPHPKPRNIEKDVKVFPWSILANALKKIIGKYSASYSSTASALLTPDASSWGSTESSVDYYPPSPHPQFAASSAGPYPVVTTVGYPSGQIPGQMSGPATTAPMPDLQLQVPSLGPAYDISDPYVFASMPGMPQASMPLMHESMSAPVGRMPQSWDFPHFVQQSPSSMPPNSAPPVAYHRGPIETADFVTPATYRMR